MIFKLLNELRPLATHKTVYDSYTHAVDIMGILANQSNNEYLILSGLLHEVKDKLGQDKLENCMDIIKKNYDSQQAILAERVIRTMLSDYSRPEGMSKQDFAFKVLSDCNGVTEKLLLADILSEVRLTKSETIRQSYKSLINTCVQKGLLQIDDSLITEIYDVIIQKSVTENA